MQYRPSSFALLLNAVVVALACPSSSLLAQNSSSNSGLRDWSDATGNHTIRAEFIGVIDRAKVALRTEDGKEMTIELSQLSNVDIYQAVKSDLMAKLALAAPVAPSIPRPPKKAQTSTGDKLLLPARKARPVTRGQEQFDTALPVSKPKPRVDDDLVARVDEFIETIENEDTETIFQMILHPKEFKEFSNSANYDTGLAKFEKEKKAKLLAALQSIDFESIERKPGGKYQFQTDSYPIRFKKLKGRWYLKN
jgi:hypothetical protein